MAINPNKCVFTDNITGTQCKICQKRFKMDKKNEFCCLDLCGELPACLGCKSGTRSKEYKEWSETHANRI